MNNVCLIGNLTRDPEVKYTTGGTAVCELGVAINKKWTDRDKQRKEKTIFIDVVCWGNTAELAGDYLKKGRKVGIEGELDQDNWEDKSTGAKRTKLKVTCNKLDFIGGRQEQSGDGDQSATQRTAGEESQVLDDAPF